MSEPVDFRWESGRLVHDALDHDDSRALDSSNGGAGVDLTTRHEVQRTRARNAPEEIDAAATAHVTGRCRMIAYSHGRTEAPKSTDSGA